MRNFTNIFDAVRIRKRAFSRQRGRAIYERRGYVQLVGSRPFQESYKRYFRVFTAPHTNGKSTTTTAGRAGDVKEKIRGGSRANEGKITKLRHAARG